MIMRLGVVCPPPQSSEVRGRLSPSSILPHKWGRKMLQYARFVPACGSVSFPRVAGEGRDGGQRAEEVVCPPPQSSEVRGRLSPASILPHKWGRKTLLYASTLPACGSVSFLRVAGEGRDGGQRAEEVVFPHINPLKCEVVCPPPQSSPINGGGRRCNMPALYPHVAAYQRSQRIYSAKAAAYQRFLRLRCISMETAATMMMPLMMS